MREWMSELTKHANELDQASYLVLGIASRSLTGRQLFAIAIRAHRHDKQMEEKFSVAAKGLEASTTDYAKQPTMRNELALTDASQEMSNAALLSSWNVLRKILQS